MVRLDFLDDNLLLIINKLMENQRLAQYLVKDSKDIVINNPLDTVPVGNLLFKKIFPTPFDEKVTKDACSQLRVYYDTVDLDGTVIEDAVINFDIVVAKSLWLVNVANADGAPISDPSLLDTRGRVRPYRIFAEIVNTFADKTIATLGELKFHRGRHLYVNETFDAFQIKAQVMTIAKHE